MSDILSQSEIEALLSSLTDSDGDLMGAAANTAPAPSTPKSASSGGGASTAGAKKSTRSAVAYEVYDFRRPDKFSKEQLRTLQNLHETFARLAGTQLSAYLRTQVNIDLISLEQVPYEEYLRSINQSAFSILSLPPLTGQSALEIEFSLVFTMLDKLLGGPGRTIDRAMLTEIEQPLFRQLVEKVLTALKTAWEGVVIVNPGVEGLETTAQFVQIAPPTDIVMSILFEIRVGDSHGAMSLCIPYMVLKPITAKLSAQKWFAASSNRKQTNAHRRSLLSQVSETELDCWVRLGRSRVSVNDFMRLRPGDVLRLDQKTKNHLDMLVTNAPKFEVRAALDGKNIVFEVIRPKGADRRLSA